jgi:hypothetical protein
VIEDILSFNVEALLVVLITISIVAHMATAIAFITLVRYLFKPVRETLVFEDYTEDVSYTEEPAHYENMFATGPIDYSKGVSTR